MGFFDSITGANKARDAIRLAGIASRDELQRGYDDVAGMYRPFVEGGGLAYSRLLDLSGVRGPGQAGVAYDAFRRSPGYMAGLDEGIGAIDRSAVGRATGNTLRDLVRFGNDYADRGFADYYNRIGGIADTGYSATGATARARERVAGGLAGVHQMVGQGDANAALTSGAGKMAGLQTLANLAGFAIGGGFGVPTSAMSAPALRRQPNPWYYG